MGRRIWQSKKLIITTLLFAIGVGVFVFAMHGGNASAQGFDIGQALRTAIGSVLESTINLLTRGIGALMFKMVGLLVLVGNYSDFINAPAVTKGWILARDVMNMFFVIVLLVIAISTILQKKELAYQAMLPRLIITALVINFSKTICGLLIDASQIFMLTFFGAIANASGANFAVLAGIPSIFSKGANSACGVDAVAGAVGDIFTSLFAFIFALVMIVIATIVIAALLIMLIVRIVTLWFLVILSPVAFFFIGLKQIDTQGIGKTWTTEFMKQIFFGPAVGFFLWLSLAVTQDQVGSEPDVRKVNMTGALGPTFSAKIGALSITTGLDATCGETGAMGTGGLMSMLVGMGLLIGTLVVAGQTSNKAGSAVSGFAMGVIKGDKMKFTPWAMAKQGVKEQMGRTSEFLQAKQNLGLSKAINFGRKKMGMQPIETRAGAKNADYEAKKKEEQTSISKKAGRFNELTTSERDEKALKTAGIKDVKSLELARDAAQTKAAAARAAGNNKKADDFDKEVSRLNTEITDTRGNNKDPRALKEELDAAKAAHDAPEIARLTGLLDKAIADIRKTKPQNGQDLTTLVEMMLKNRELDATNINHQELVNKVLEYRKADPKGLQAFNEELMKENPRMYLATSLNDLTSTDSEKKKRAEEKFVEMEKLGKLDAAKIRGKRTAADTRKDFESNDGSISDMEKLKLLQTMAEKGELREGDLNGVRPGNGVKDFDELMKTQGMIDQRKTFRENIQKTNDKLYFELALTKKADIPDPNGPPGAMLRDATVANSELLLNEYKAGKFDPSKLTKEQSDLLEDDPEFAHNLMILLNVKQREQFLTKVHEANENNLTATIQTSFRADIAAAPDDRSRNLLIAKLAKMQKSLVMTDAAGQQTLPDTNTIQTLISNGHLKMSDFSKMDLTTVPDAEKEKLFRYITTLSDQQIANLADVKKEVAEEALNWMRTPRVMVAGGPTVDLTPKLTAYRASNKLRHLTF